MKKSNFNRIKDVIEKVIVFLMLAVAVCSINFCKLPYTVYAGPGETEKLSPFRVKLSEVDNSVKSVTAEAEVVDVQYYLELDKKNKVRYLWDSEKGFEGEKYVITKPGTHTLYIYLYKDASYYLYGTIGFKIDNIDTVAPSIGNVRMERNGDQWRAVIENSSDNKGTDKLRYLLMTEDKELPCSTVQVLKEAQNKIKKVQRKLFLCL